MWFALLVWVVVGIMIGILGASGRARRTRQP
jgi:hypothetical protein